MGPLELLVERDTSKQDLDFWHVKLRGLFQVRVPTDLTVVTSIFDITDKESPAPIISAAEEFQEPETLTFLDSRNIGVCNPGQGFQSWSVVGVIPKDLLEFPYGGNRELSVVVRVVDEESAPEFEWGLPSTRSGIIQELTKTISFFVERGFLERTDEELGIGAASLRLAIALAFSDGSFDPLEGRLIQGWAKKFVDKVPEGPGREQARGFVNDAIRYGMMDGRDKKLSIESQIEVLNKLADKPSKYSAIELCLDVMAADKQANAEELKMLNRLCASLSLSLERFNKLRDRRLMDVESRHIGGEDIWETLSIDSKLSPTEKRAQLSKLFVTWNGRTESEDKETAEKAHHIIELITKARALLNA